MVVLQLMQLGNSKGLSDAEINKNVLAVVESIQHVHLGQRFRRMDGVLAKVQEVENSPNSREQRFREQTTRQIYVNDDS